MSVTAQSGQGPPGADTGRGRRGSRADRRSARRGELLEAAIRVIRREGVSASMDDMAAEAGISKPILYRHFGHKVGLYHAVAERYATALLEELSAVLSRETGDRELIDATFRAYLSFLERETHVYRFLMLRVLRERPELGAQLAGFHDQVATEVARLLRDRLKPAGLDTGGVEAWAYAIVGMATFAGEWWMQAPAMSKEHLVEYLTTLLWDGFSGIVTRARATDAESDGKEEQP